jgi:hypothetical protein
MCGKWQDHAQRRAGLEEDQAMSMGIEQFRSQAMKEQLENRRVTVEGEGQNRQIRAPNDLLGRFIDWIKGPNIGDERQTENKRAHRVFYEALEKAYGSEIAKRALENTVGLDQFGFKQEITNLTAKTVKQVLDSAHKEYTTCLGENAKNAQTFVESRRLKTTAFNNREGCGHPGLSTTDPDLTRAFFKLIGSHPDYGRRVFRDDELEVFARQAVKDCCDMKRGRFDEQYPHLAKIDNGHFHDRETYFGDFSRSLNKPPLNPLAMNPTGEPMDTTLGMKWFEKSLESIQESTELLGTTEFDVNEARQLQEEIRNQIAKLEGRLNVQPNVLENGFRGICGKFANHAMQHALTKALDGCGYDLTPRDELILDIDDLESNRNIDIEKLGEQKNEDELILRLDENIDEPVEKKKKKVTFNDEVEVKYFDAPRDDTVKKKSQTQRSQVEKLENPVHDLFVNKHLQGFLNDLILGDPPGSLTDPGQREELTRQMCGKLDAYLMEHDVPEEERKDRVKVFEQEFLEQINREGTDQYPGMGKITQCVEFARPLQESISEEIRNQIGKLKSKQQYLDDYIGADPLSQKAIAYDRLVWAQTTVTALEDVIRNLAGQLPEGVAREDMTRQQQRIYDHMQSAIVRLNQARQRVHEAKTEYENAPSERAPGVDGSTARQIAGRNRRLEIRQMEQYLEESRIHLRRGETTGDYLDRMRVKTLETLSQWQPIVRDMQVTRDGVTRTYRSEIVPGSQIGGAVGRSYQEHGVKGLAPGDRINTQHAPNLQVSYLSRIEKDENGEETKTGMLRTIRHGVLDSFGIESDLVRKEVSKTGAKEVLTTVVEINDGFKQRALDKHDQGNQPPSKIVHVNINLMPSEFSGLPHGRREGDFIQHQFDAFDEVPNENGRVLLPVVNEQNIFRNIEFEVDTISFAFGVPKDEDEAKRFDEHDRQNMIKLVGDPVPGTAIGGTMGGLVEKLTVRRRRQDTPEEEKQAITELLAKIRGEVDTVRDQFSSGRYKTTDEDRHRMARHVMRVVDLGGEALRLLGDDDTILSLSEGCRDNLDDSSIVDVEHKSQAIIEDMGGSMSPGIELSEEDRNIYNTVLTSSGQVEMQRMTTGLGGTGSVDGVSDRSGDSKALEYSRGFESSRRV